jgi:hypothetical protein
MNTGPVNTLHTSVSYTHERAWALVSSVTIPTNLLVTVSKSRRSSSSSFLNCPRTAATATLSIHVLCSLTRPTYSNSARTAQKTHLPTILLMKNAVFLDVTPCSSCNNRRFWELSAPIIRVTRIGELGTLAVDSNGRKLLASYG